MGRNSWMKAFVMKHNWACKKFPKGNCFRQRYFLPALCMLLVSMSVAPCGFAQAHRRVGPESDQRNSPQGRQGQEYSNNRDRNFQPPMHSNQQPPSRERLQSHTHSNQQQPSGGHFQSPTHPNHQPPAQAHPQGQTRANQQPHEYHGKYEEEKQKYDEGLVHLYNKLNSHFIHNNMKISRLDVVRFPENAKREHPPIFFRTTTTRRPRTHAPFIIPITVMPSTTTTTTTTTTTPRPPPFRTVPANVPVGHVRIVGEVNVDENRFYKPVSVIVHGKKLNALLNVVPKEAPHAPKEVVNFNEDPDISGAPHPQFHFGTHHHPRKNSPARPLHPRKHLLYRHQARDEKPHNAIDKAVDQGIKSVTNFARSILPGALLPKLKPQPKMHKFDRISPESPKYVRRGPHLPFHQPERQQNGQYGNEMDIMEDGLQHLRRIDKEIPR